MAGFACGDGNTGIKFSVGLFRAVGGREEGLAGVPKVKSSARQPRLLRFILLRSLSDTLLVVSILEIITVIITVGITKSCFFGVFSIPVGSYIVKVNNRNTRTRCEICSK